MPTPTSLDHARNRFTRRRPQRFHSTMPATASLDDARSGFIKPRPRSRACAAPRLKRNARRYNFG
eukprot:365544-Chlamydomonas_euryale.AAC.6